MRVYSHSYWLANYARFCTTNSSLVLSRENKTQFFHTKLRNVYVGKVHILCNALDIFLGERKQAKAA